MSLPTSARTTSSSLATYLLSLSAGVWSVGWWLLSEPRSYELLVVAPDGTGLHIVFGKGHIAAALAGNHVLVLVLAWLVGRRAHD